MSSTPSVAAIERRRSKRRKILKTARIVDNEKRCIADCTIKDLSERGAKLDTAVWIELPKRFDLMIPGGPTFACEVLWSINSTLAVRFLSDDDFA